MASRTGWVVSSCVILMACGGCYPNKAVIDPWSYAPQSSSTTWKPPSKLKPMELSDAPPDLPEQQEPYSLGELIDIALRNNVQTKLTWAQARAAAAQYGQSQSQFFPAFSGSFDYQRARQPVATNSGIVNQGTVDDVYYSVYGPQLQIAYLIFDFGTLRATSEAARQALYTADWTHNDAIQTLLQTIMNDFYSYAYQEQLLIADVANVETAQLTFDAAELGLETGVRDISDVLQAKTQLLQNQTSWAAQQLNVETSFTTLLNDMGLPANIDIATQDLPTELPENDYLPEVETLIATAIQNRPDLLASEANLKSKEQTLRATRTQFLPQINYNFDLGKTYYNDNLHDKYNFTSTFSLTFPIFSGFYYRNAIKIAEANKKQAEEQLKQTELSVVMEITNYHYNVKVAYETLQFAIAYLEAAKEQYVVALSQYKQGVNTILDVVSAQSSLADARAQKASAVQQWFSSLANLAYATGLISPTSLTPFNQGITYEE